MQLHTYYSNTVFDMELTGTRSGTVTASLGGEIHYDRALLHCGNHFIRDEFRGRLARDECLKAKLRSVSYGETRGS